MKTRVVVPIAVFSFAVISCWHLTRSAAANDVSPALTAVVSAVTVDSDGAEYVGSNKCKKCHIAEYKSWDKKKHGNAFETLMPGKATETKTKFNIDTGNDFTTNAECLACHTVGYDQPGGYHTPADDKEARKVKHLKNVGCEMCHGPGSEYIEFHEKVMKEKLEYTDEDMYAHGMKKITKETCTQCHNAKSPTMNEGDEFDFEKMKEMGVHEHKDLKLHKG